MSDTDDRIDEEEQQDQSESVEVGKKVGFLPAVVIKILQFAALAILGVILVVTISWATFNILIQGKISETQHQTSEVYKPKTEKLTYYKGLKPIRGLTSDSPPKTFIAELSIGYPKTNTLMQNELIERSEKIGYVVLMYLANKTSDQLVTKNAEILGEEIKRYINDIMEEKISEVLFAELMTF